MNKIKTLLKGGSISMLLMTLATVGVASAAIVNYLSNYTQTTATVVSPIVMSVNEGTDQSETGNPAISIATQGGSDFTFTTVARNNANNPINGYPLIVVKETDGGKLTGKEFTKVMFKDANGEWPIIGHLYVVHGDGHLEALSNRTWDNSKLVLFFDNTPDGTAQPYPIEAGAVNWNTLTITTNQAIVGTYEIYAQYAPDLASYAASQYAN